MVVGAITCCWLSGVASIDVARSSLSSYCPFSAPRHAVHALVSKNGDGVPERAANFSSIGKGDREADVISHKKFFGKPKVERPFSYEDSNNGRQDMRRSHSTVFRSSVMQRKDKRGFAYELKEQQV